MTTQNQYTDDYVLSTLPSLDVIGKHKHGIVKIQSNPKRIGASIGGRLILYIDDYEQFANGRANIQDAGEFTTNIFLDGKHTGKIDLRSFYVLKEKLKEIEKWSGRGAEYIPIINYAIKDIDFTINADNETFQKCSPHMLRLIERYTEHLNPKTEVEDAWVENSSLVADFDRSQCVLSYARDPCIWYINKKSKINIRVCEDNGIGKIEIFGDSIAQGILEDENMDELHRAYMWLKGDLAGIRQNVKELRRQGVSLQKLANIFAEEVRITGLEEDLYCATTIKPQGIGLVEPYPDVEERISYFAKFLEL